MVEDDTSGIEEIADEGPSTGMVIMDGNGNVLHDYPAVAVYVQIVRDRYKQGIISEEDLKFASDQLVELSRRLTRVGLDTDIFRDMCSLEVALGKVDYTPPHPFTPGVLITPRLARLFDGIEQFPDGSCSKEFYLPAYLRKT